MSFKTKSNEELQKLNTQELADYYAELQEYKLSQKADNSVIEDIKSELSKIEDLQKSVEKLAEKAAKKPNGEEVRKSVIDQIKSKLQENAEVIKSLKDGQKVQANFEIKATTVTTGNDNSVTPALTQHTSEIIKPALEMPFLLDYVSSGSVDKATVHYTEIENFEASTPGTTAEAALKAQSDFEWITKTASAEKTTSFMKVSEEALDDYSFVATEINSYLNYDLAIKTEAAVATKIASYMPSFAAGDLAGTVQDASESDVLRAAINQIIVNSNGKYYPNLIVLHPSDFAKMELTKDANGQYVIPPFRTASGAEISGVKVIQKVNSNLPQGEFWVGDYTRVRFKSYKSPSIQVGWENDDFTKNLRTILTEQRYIVYLPSHERSAFVKGSFATGKTALETV